jgi:hypothetical protein
MGSGDKRQHNGALIVTSERAVFYRKGWFGEVLETMPLDKITSIERKTILGHKVVRLHTSHDQLEFKTFESWEHILSVLEERSGSGTGPVPIPTPIRPDSDVDRLKKLAGLREAGLITEDEFAAKRADILAQV